MFKPSIYAKSSLTREQMDVKCSIGCDGLEIQLLGELVEDRSIGKYKRPEEVFNIKDLEKYPVSVVHAPLLPGQGDLVLEVLCDRKDCQLLQSVFEIANFYGEIQSKKIIVVFHTETFLDKINDIGQSWNNMVQVIGYMLDRYPNTELVIENVSPLRGIGKGKELHLANNFAFDNVAMVKELRRTLNTDRVGTCLDTCHAMLTDKYIGGLYAMVGDVPVPDLSMQEYFRRNAECLKLIHLADINGSGYGKGRHGVPFNHGTYTRLKKILDIYNDAKISCPLTLEVEETDYSVCDGFRNTKDMVELYYKSVNGFDVQLRRLYGVQKIRFTSSL